MVLQGRLKMNEVLGSGKLEMFNQLKQHFGTEDAASHISLLSDAKKGQKRESKIAGNDDVLNAYQSCDIPEGPTTIDIDGKKNKKDKKKRKLDKSERQKANANVLEKFVKNLKVKEIRPLHLDSMDKNA